ncbi:MAG: molecular chaperone [Cellvibrio sp.]
MAADLNSKTTLSRLFLLISATFLVLIASNATANKVGIWPIDPVVKFGENHSKIQIRNLDLAHPVRIQAKIQRWEQIDNQDVLTDQNELAISPPQIEIAPGVEQLFRIIVKQKNGAQAGEATYRILIDLVPNDSPAAKTTSGLNLAMRYSLPLYVHNEANNSQNRAHIDHIESLMSYRLETPSKLVVTNRSNWSQRLSKVALKNSDQETLGVIADGLMGYVLPNSSRRFDITAEQFALLQRSPYPIAYTYKDKEYRVAPQQ